MCIRAASQNDRANLGELDGGIGCVLGGLDHSRASGGERGADLASDHRVGEVPLQERGEHVSRVTLSTTAIRKASEMYSKRKARKGEIRAELESVSNEYGQV